MTTKFTATAGGDGFTVVSHQGILPFGGEVADQFYTAKFDNRDYPIQHDTKGTTIGLGSNAVSLKRVDRNTLAEYRKKDRQIVIISRMTISSDGRRMTQVDADQVDGTVETWVLQK